MSTSSIGHTYDFTGGTNDFKAGFSDYPPGQESAYELAAGIRPLPAELGVAGTGYLLSGNNHSDDLFMFIKRRLGPEDGIVPNGKYRAAFEIVFASNAPKGALGTGGSPGESVYLKAGGSAIEPLAVTKDSDLRMNIDKGEQANDGADASVAGNIANGRRADEPIRYVTITRQHRHKPLIAANSQGVIWLFIGTDSGFEATTTLYYQTITVTLELQ